MPVRSAAMQILSSLDSAKLMSTALVSMICYNEGVCQRMKGKLGGKYSYNSDNSHLSSSSSLSD
jgi:hypothetical protein